MRSSWREALYARRSLGVELSLATLEQAYTHLGRPLRGLPVIHIVGTNGKGSTAAMAAHGLRHAGKRVGLFTSPHLHRLNERIRIDGEPVADDLLDQTFERVLHAEHELLRADKIGRTLTFFELLTLAACLRFSRSNVDVAVLEAGMGGRYDATRVATSSVTLISRIGLDHEHILGPGLAAIAGEKAAVIHAGAPCFSVAQHPDVVPVIERAAITTGTELTWVEPAKRAPKALPGVHQRDNAALALAAVQTLVPAADLSWFDDVSWPGRLERVAMGGGTVVFDVAHNPDGIATLVNYLRMHQVPNRILVFGCMRDKAAKPMLAGLTEIDAPLWLAASRTPGAADVGELADLAPGRAERLFGAGDRRLPVAIRAALTAGSEVCICGSCYLVGELRGLLLELAPEADLGDPLVRRSPR